MCKSISTALMRVLSLLGFKHLTFDMFRSYTVHELYSCVDWG